MKIKRHKTSYAGVYYILGTNPTSGKQEKVYHIRYRTRRPDGSWAEHSESAGRQYRDNMTPAKASHIRAERIRGHQLPNKERRAKAKEARQKRSWTISALWEAYKDANPGLKGMQVYEAIYNAHVHPIFGDKQPKQITPMDIDRLRHRQMKGKSPKSVSNALELLRRLANFGNKHGLCEGPGFTIQLPKVHNEKTEDLSPQELTRLLQVIDRHINERNPSRFGAYAIKLALLSGMRRGEMFKLKWDDIDWHRRNILLRDAKSGKDERIPLSRYTAELFEEIKRIEGTDSEFVLPGMAGGMRSSIARAVNNLKQEAALPGDFRPLHGCRHVFASGLISHGIPKDIVARLLCHKGRGLVTDRYAHVRDDALMAAAELAGRLLEATDDITSDVKKLSL